MKKHIRNIALLIVVVTVAIVIINKVINFLANIGENLPIGNGKYYSWKYGNVFYVKKGKGSPILLVHDLTPSSSAYEWEKTINTLAKSHTVYALDLLGCGRSEKPNLTYTNFLYVQLINSFIRNVIGSSCDVITSGSSISFVIMACQLENGNFKKIIGISPVDMYDMIKIPTKRHNLLKSLLDMPVIGSLIYNIVSSKYKLRALVSKRYYFKSHMVSNEMVLAYHQGAHLYDGRGKYLLASIKSHYTNINIAPAVKNINHTVTLIGGREHPYMEDIINDYLILNPAFEAVYLDECKYLPQCEIPEKLCALLNILLDTE